MSLEGNLRGNSNLGARLSAVYVPTGQILSGNQGKINDWTKSGTLSKEGRQEIEKLIDKNSSTIELAGSYFRAQNLDLSANEVPIERLGPPSEIQSTAGRYNYSNQPFLYLSSLELGAWLEVQDGIEANGQNTTWILKFRISKNAPRVFDLTNLKNEDLNNLMFFCELCHSETEPPNGYPVQSLSREISNILLNKGFHGMQIHGVRGNSNIRYNNIVIFQHKNWRRWVESKPYKFPRISA